MAKNVGELLNSQKQKYKQKLDKKKRIRKMAKLLKKKDIKVSILPKNTLKILHVIREKGLVTQKQIIMVLESENVRSISYSIRRLIKFNVLIKRANFEDMRQYFLDINPDVIEYLEIKYDLS